MTSNPRWIATAALVMSLPLTLAADTLYLRNGTRVQGDLVAVRGNTIEFEERRGGFGGTRTIRVDRSEVDRIEFDGTAAAATTGAATAAATSRAAATTRRRRRPPGRHARTAGRACPPPWTGPTRASRFAPARRLRSRRRARSAGARIAATGRRARTTRRSTRRARCPIAPAGALIGRIGGDVFFIGDGRGPIRVRNSGRLQLGDQRRVPRGQLRELPRDGYY